MAAPPEIKLSDLTGDWVMNKTLSDDPDPVLALQGIGWMTRKAISWATVTLHVTQTTDPSGLTHITIANTATGGIKGTTEERQLDWTFREHDDHMFGSLRGRSRWLTPSTGREENLDPYLFEGWEENGEEAGPGGETKIESLSESNGKGWVADQIWGFAVVDGKRYHVRRVVVSKGGEVIRVRFVYDWQGKK